MCATHEAADIARTAEELDATVDLSDDASSGSDILRSPLSSDSCTAETPSTCVSETLSVSRPSLILLDSSASEDLLKSL